MKVHDRSLIKARCHMATPKFADPIADAQFNEHARQDVMALLAEVKRLERELARARLQAVSRAGRVPR